MKKALFTHRSTLGHVVRMTAANTVALMALFGVDLADMYFLSLLGEQELAAAVGFGGTLMFFLVAVSIGLQIGMGALVSRAEGAHDRELAGRHCSNILIFSAFAAGLISAVGYLYLPQLLRLLGASGQTLDYALSYTRILVPSAVVLAVGMCAANAARALGDAKRAMLATLAGALVNAALDPVLIFSLGLGVQGAAIASVVARCVTMALAFHAIFRVHHLPQPTSVAALRADLGNITRVALPAMLTNLATPIGSSFVLRTMAQFGDSAVAGVAIMGRVSPVAFAAVFALSGAIGPIVGQNAGAGRYDRVGKALRDALWLISVYVLVVWLLLWLMADLLVAAFSATGEAARLIRFFLSYLPWGFLFLGLLFVANASFNNLHRAHLATALNFGRALLGTVPCAWLGARWFGPPGVMGGEAVAALMFGVLGFSLVMWQVRDFDRRYSPPINDTAPL